ncbi:MAG: ornithine carbamoyltransferase [Romboutsia timonensis]
MKHKNLEGKNIAILFEKIQQEQDVLLKSDCNGFGHMGALTYLGPTGSQMGKKESIADTARVLGRMYDGIEYRGFSQSIVEELADYAGVPVWNGLTDEFHPTQILADLLTIEEKFGKLKGVNFVYIGDARNNMGNSLMVACAKMGLNFTSCAPKELFPSQELVSKCKEIADKNGCTITLTEDVMEGTKNADVIYTDVWVSMGEPDEVWEDRIKQLKPYQVNADIMKNANSQAIFMHCLPSFHDLKTKIGAEMGEKFGITEMEVTNEVFESKKSVVFDEAENRMHTIKAIMAATIGQ